MRKRAFLSYRPVFWSKFYVANIKLVLFGFNTAKHYGLFHVPFRASGDKRSRDFGPSF